MECAHCWAASGTFQIKSSLTKNIHSQTSLIKIILQTPSKYLVVFLRKGKCLGEIRETRPRLKNNHNHAVHLTLSILSTSALISSLGRTFPPASPPETLPKAAPLAAGAGVGAGAGLGAGAGAGLGAGAGAGDLRAAVSALSILASSALALAAAAALASSSCANFFSASSALALAAAASAYSFNIKGK